MYVYKRAMKWVYSDGMSDTSWLKDKAFVLQHYKNTIKLAGNRAKHTLNGYLLFLDFIIISCELRTKLNKKTDQLPHEHS